MKNKIPLIILWIGLLVVNNVRADNCKNYLSGKADFAEKDICFYAGLGVAGFQSEYQEAEDGVVFPLILLMSDIFYWSDEEVGLYFAGDEIGQSYWGSALTLAYVDEGFKEPEDEPQLRGLDELDATVDAGIKLNFGGSWGDVEVHVSKTMSDEHDGIRVRSGYGFSFSYSDVTFTPNISFTYSDEERSNYYYGVSAADVSLSRPVYELDATLNYSLGYDVTYMLNNHWLLFHSLGVTVLDDDISESPLVVSEDPYFLALGVFYTFD